jgi:hypothetical protein
MATTSKPASPIAILKLPKSVPALVTYADIETAATVIQSAGIVVKKMPVRKPRAFPAEEGMMSGSVKLVAASAGRDRRVPVPGGHQDRRGQLEPDGAAHREMSPAPPRQER